MGFIFGSRMLDIWFGLQGSAERWERIAGKVAGKTKEQCMVRFKHIAEMIKKKKEAAE